MQGTRVKTPSPLSPFQSFLLSMLWICLYPHEAFSGQYRVRVREHYEYHQMRFQDQDLLYRGFSNTFNFWYEEPFDFAVGLAGGSVLSAPTRSPSSPPLLGERIKFNFLGVEAKAFQGSNLFTRIGLYWNEIQSSSPHGNLYGWSYYAGLGGEFLILEKLSLAPEIGLRQGQTDNLFFTSLSLALGIHFYYF